VRFLSEGMRGNSIIKLRSRLGIFMGNTDCQRYSATSTHTDCGSEGRGFEPRRSPSILLVEHKTSVFG